MCGRLLYSAHSSADRNLGVVGKAAYACQVRTPPPTQATWDAMPLFLLLWTKRKLSETLLRGVTTFNSDQNRLVLKGGVESCPWLHWR
eukprot:2505173-Karenia_brevis.AAC.1